MSAVAPEASTIRTVGVLLAAGAGQRFDPSQPGRKLEVLVAGVSVAERSLASLVPGTDAIVAVSYTHLDVYKRQPSTMVSGISARVL